MLWGSSKANRKLHVRLHKLEGLGLMSWICTEADYSRNVNPSDVFQLEKWDHRLNFRTKKKKEEGKVN